jgi:hypothetical protein
VKKLILCVLGTFGFAFPALAYDLAQNGGFEAGSLASWQTFNQGASGGTGSWYAHSNGNGTYSGLPTSPPPSGSWQAVADNSGRAAAILYRDFTIPATTRAVLSLVLWHGNAAPGGYVNGSSLNPSITNQRVRIDIISTSANLLLTSSVIQVVYATSAGTPAIVNPTTITQDVTSLAGQTVRLRIALVGTNGPIIAGVDQVKLEVSPFTLFTQLPGMAYGTAHFGDFDRNDILDVAYNGWDGAGPAWQVWRFDGSWSAYSQPLTGLYNGSTAIGDFDRDGDLDLAGAGNSPFRFHDLLVYRNDGLLSFSPIPQPGSFFNEPGTHHGSLDWADWENDGDLDLLVTGMNAGFPSESPATFLQVGDGAGNFTKVFPGLPGTAGGNAVWSNMSLSGIPGVGLCGSNVTDAFLADGNGGFSSLALALPGVTNGAVAIGDLDNDGVADVLVTGLNGSTRIAKVYALATGTEMPAGLTGVSESAVSLGDFDNDGWLDIALCGNTGSTNITRIYRNNGNGTFTNLDAGLPGIAQGNLEFGDFDADGDLDLLLQGTTNAPAVPICHIYMNAPMVANAAPSPPSGLSSFWQTDSELGLSLSSFGVDDHTAGFVLTNNFRAGSSPGAVDIVSPMSNPISGLRYVPRAGESDQGWMRPLKLSSIGHGSLYWSVQAVDQSLIGSQWAPEQVLTVGPAIGPVVDVPQDQGGWVRLTVQASVLDDASRTLHPATGYNVWRRIPGSIADQVARAGNALAAASVTARLQGIASAEAGETGLPLIEWRGRLFTRSAGISLANPFPAGTWEIVGSFYAMPGQGNYTVLTPTVADSGMSGPNDATFIVTVHTTTPSVWFASLPVAGRSRDNLAPATPQWVSAAYHTGSGNHLTWEPSTANDLHEYRIHRSTQPLFFPGPGTLVATVTSPEWVDPDHDTPGWYYFICAVDHAGNQSGFAAPDNVTAVDPTTPVAFALSTASPNPFAASTRIAFGLPQATATRLDVFDTSGRLVRTLVNGLVGAGNHEATWDGADRSGQRVKSGVYFYRLRAGSFQSSRRVVVGS